MTRWAPQPAEERFWAKVDRRGADQCWLWLASKDRAGYARFMWSVEGSLRDRKPFYVHRIAYELLVGPIPEGLFLDHLCRVRHCVNPAHLEPVTCIENVRRGRSGALNREKTHCPHGHPYEAPNIYYHGVGGRYRQCVACRIAQSRAQWARSKSRSS